MFEDRKRITVNGVSFDMILVEGDKFFMDELTKKVGDVKLVLKRAQQLDLDDFYMAEIPVTQELYSAVMDSSNTTSYNMIPENFNYLHPNLFTRGYSSILDESYSKYQERLYREEQSKTEREKAEIQRIKTLAKGLPVNCISWQGCLRFIEMLNSLTGLCFALPSHEQWYYAAIGGADGKRYDFAGSNNFEEVGHFQKSHTIKKWYERPKMYKPNELGIYDMSGLVYEWLDEPGYVIGGSFHSHPNEVSKKHHFGYSHFKTISSSLGRHWITIGTSYDSSIHAGDLFGFRLILQGKPKKYSIPELPSNEEKIGLTKTEEDIFYKIIEQRELGLLRRVIGNKYETRTKYNHISVFGNFKCSILDIFICPQNLTAFEGKCFSHYLSKRKFVNHCRLEFKKLLMSLIKNGYNLLIHDELNLDLSDLGIYPLTLPNIEKREFRNKDAKLWLEVLKSNSFSTNNNQIIEIERRELPPYQIGGPSRGIIDLLKVADNIILIDIGNSHDVKREENVESGWLAQTLKLSNGSNYTRLTFSCFCNFRSDMNDTEFNYSSIGYKSTRIVRNMRNKIIKSIDRINNEDFNSTELINKLFRVRNFDGSYEYKYPDSSGIFIAQDDSFFILPQSVYLEWRQSLQR